MNIAKAARLFSEIENTSSRTSITQLLAHILKEATPKESKQLCYLFLGELNPPYITTQFAIAQKTMVKIVAAVLEETETHVQREMARVGDLGSIIEQGTWRKTDSLLTVSEVYELLVTLEALEGTGSQEKKRAHMVSLLHALDPLSAKYTVRIVMGKLRLGFSDMTIIDALSWMVAEDKSLSNDIEQAYNICADIGLLAHDLKVHGIKALRSMKIHMGIPIRPAAAERLPDCQSILKKIGPCVAQPKLDGFRLQVHIDKRTKTSKIHFFSRNLLDMSAMFPEFVAVCEQIQVSTFIADGEAMVYDPETYHFLPFQETVKRKRKHGIDAMVSELPLQLYLFDLLYFDGEDLLEYSHEKRRALLQDALRSVKDHRVQVIEEKVIRTAEQLEDYFVEEIEAGLEGIVVKKKDAPYQAGRRNFNWIKLKYEASSKMEDTLDVVILGYYPGKGKRAKLGIGAFLVGIFNPREDCFETVAKIGTGMSDAQWVDLKARCDAIQARDKPHNVVCDKSLYPAVWVDPSIVCEVLADNITVSPVHTAGKKEGANGLALRFPRFLKYRIDKSFEQTTSYEELREMIL